MAIYNIKQAVKSCSYHQEIPQIKTMSSPCYILVATGHVAQSLFASQLVKYPNHNYEHDSDY
jgi:hypothetical protein